MANAPRDASHATNAATGRSRQVPPCAWEAIESPSRVTGNRRESGVLDNFVLMIQTNYDHNNTILPKGGDGSATCGSTEKYAFALSESATAVDRNG